MLTNRENNGDNKVLFLRRDFKVAAFAICDHDEGKNCLS